MVSVEIRSLLSRLNRFCSKALENAAGMCVSRRIAYVRPTTSPTFGSTRPSSSLTERAIRNPDSDRKRPDSK